MLFTGMFIVVLTTYYILIKVCILLLIFRWLTIYPPNQQGAGGKAKIKKKKWNLSRDLHLVYVFAHLSAPTVIYKILAKCLLEFYYGVAGWASPPVLPHLSFHPFQENPPRHPETTLQLYNLTEDPS